MVKGRRGGWLREVVDEVKAAEALCPLAGGFR
jgi:hypothetical protein